MTRLLRPMSFAAFAVTAVLWTSAPAAPRDDAPPAAPEVDPAWLDRLSRVDRELMSTLLGKRPPAIPEDVQWIGGTAETWDAAHGSVIVLQSFSNRSGAGRRALARWAEPLATVAALDDVKVRLLQTPDGAKSIVPFLERDPQPHPVLVDPSGAFCDALGIYKAPANLVIGRGGRVRYVGLNEEGLAKAVALLRAEPTPPKPTDEPEAGAPKDDDDLPPFPFVDERMIGSARNMLGQRAPEFMVEEWETAQPNPRGRVIGIAFWHPERRGAERSAQELSAFGRGRSAIPIVAIVGASSSSFEEEMGEADLDVDDFAFAVALDEQRRMQRAFDSPVEPYLVIVSSDWVVRWQGAPNALPPTLLEQIVAIDAERQKAAAKKDKSRTPRRNRWQRG